MTTDMLNGGHFTKYKEVDGNYATEFIRKRSRNCDLKGEVESSGSFDVFGVQSPLDKAQFNPRSFRYGLVDVPTFVLDLELEGMTGLSNVVAYSSPKTDLQSHEEEYRSFKACLAGCNLAYRKELVSLLFPVFSNLIIDLISKGVWSTAQNMIIKYGPEHEEHHREEFKKLAAAVKSQTLDESLCASIHSFELSSLLSKPVLAYLIQHISKGNHSVLLEILNKYVRFNSSTLHDHEVCGHRRDYSDREDETATHTQANESGLTLLKKLDTAIESMQKTKHKKASICFYSVVNAFQGVNSLKFSPNSHILCGGFEDSSIRIWSLTSKKLQIVKPKSSSLHKEASQEITTDYICLRGHEGPVYSTDFLNDGNTILSSSEDTSVRLWSLQHQTSLCEYRGHNLPVWSANANSSGTYFATASQDRTIRLWSTEYVYPLRIFVGHSGSVDSVTFHQNGNYIASGSYDKTCRLWDLQSGQFVRVLVGQQGSTYCLAFSMDGKYLVSAGDCSRIMIWDLGSGKLIQELNGRNDIIYSLAFSKSGTFLASAGIDGVIEVWNFKSGEPMHEPNPDVKGIQCDFMDAFTSKSCNVLALQFAQANLLYAAGGADHK